MKVFVLEDDVTRMQHLLKVLPPGTDTTIITSCAYAHKFQPPYDLILLDHDLGGRQMALHEDCGATFLDLVMDRIPANALIVIHSFNAPAAWRMGKMLERNGKWMIYIAPFKSEAFNRILDQVSSFASTPNTSASVR